MQTEGKKFRVTIFLSEKIELKFVTRDTERHYLVIKEPGQQEDRAVVSICAPSIGRPKYVCHSQVLPHIKGEVDSDTIGEGL